MTDEAMDMLHEIALGVDGAPEGLYKALAGRKVLNVSAWAMNRALICNPKHPKVTGEYVQWANTIVEHGLRYQEQLFGEKVIESGFLAAVDAIERKLKKYKGQWVSERELKNLSPLRKLGERRDRAIEEAIKLYDDDMTVDISPGQNQSIKRRFRWNK
jgi:hypothetical protein